MATDVYTIAGELPWPARCLLACAHEAGRWRGPIPAFRVLLDSPRDREHLDTLKSAGLVNERDCLTEVGFEVYREARAPIPLDCAHVTHVRFVDGVYVCGRCDPA